MLKVTLKVGKRQRRPLEIELTEEQLAQARIAFWSDLQADPTVMNLALAEDVRKRFNFSFSSRDAHVRMLHAIAAVSLHVGNIYWYKTRTPKASAHRRMRAFAEPDGTIKCPHCACIIVEEGRNQVEPHAHSQLLELPRFICYQCNTEVIVSQRREQYRAAAEEKRLAREANNDRSA